MIEPKDLSIKELKEFHKATKEKIACAKEDSKQLQTIINICNLEKI